MKPPGIEYRYRAFGFGWQSNGPLPPFAGDPEPDGSAQITVNFHHGSAPERPFLHARHNLHLAPDGFRFVAGETATIDAFDSCRAEVYDESGGVPSALFSTVAALLLAGRGCIPMHGSAVADAGSATLVCGPAGAGKSTTVARLVAAGARLISDDLSVLHPANAGGLASLYAGRRGLRLFPHAAESLGQAVRWLAPPQPATGKLVVYPPRVDPGEAFPLRRIVILGLPPGPVAARLRPAVLAPHLFRRSGLRHIPGAKLRLAMLTIATHAIDVVGAPAL